ncbi:hypothetical protein F4774DRAFT_405035 [Daldinia eschscholtzii]|nr:hypothetical protein F4774DRAFT_405035 [Daldinia eschscholtzii]
MILGSPFLSFDISPLTRRVEHLAYLVRSRKYQTMSENRYGQLTERQKALVSYSLASLKELSRSHVGFSIMTSPIYIWWLPEVIRPYRTFSISSIIPALFQSSPLPRVTLFPHLSAPGYSVVSKAFVVSRP